MLDTCYEIWVYQNDEKFDLFGEYEFLEDAKKALDLIPTYAWYKKDVEDNGASFRILEITRKELE